MSDRTINFPALITRSVLIQNAKADLDAATTEESTLGQQIQVLHDKQMLATRRRADAAAAVAQAGALADAELPVDTYRKVSLIEQEAFPERTRVKGKAFDYLFANQTADIATIANIMDSEGGPDRMHNYLGVLHAYMRNACTAAMIPENTWEAFRAFILFIGKDAALGL